MSGLRPLRELPAFALHRTERSVGVRTDGRLEQLRDRVMEILKYIAAAIHESRGFVITIVPARGHIPARVTWHGLTCKEAQGVDEIAHQLAQDHAHRAGLRNAKG